MESLDSESKGGIESREGRISKVIRGRVGLEFCSCPPPTALIALHLSLLCGVGLECGRGIRL